LQRALGLSQPVYLHIPVAIGADGHKLGKQNLAPQVNPSAASDELRRALRFPAQPKQTGSPAAILRQAAAAWMPSAIPRERHIPAE
jgi:glutamyl-Q tRNA(Asp) synthetase